MANIEETLRHNSMDLNRQQIEKVINSLTLEEQSYVLDCADKIREAYPRHFIKAFSTLRRHLSFASAERLVSVPAGESTPLLIADWDTVRFLRVWFLSLITDEEEAYVKFVDDLFAYADMQELIALYSALPVLAYPERWVGRCQEGIRSNIGGVQEAVIEQTKYPFNHLDDEAWNQLVLKAFFTGKNILKIYGLFERNNASLASSVVDYIYERDSAKRDIHPILWHLAADQLPDRAVAILTERYAAAPDRVEAALLRYVLRKYVGELPVGMLDEGSQSDISLADALEAYKNR